MERLLIVTGPMRSGTTLLTSMLHGGEREHHPNLSFAPDTVTHIREVTQYAAAHSGERLPLMCAAPSSEFMEVWKSRFREVMPQFKAAVLQAAPASSMRVFGVKLTGLLPEMKALAAMEGIEAHFVVALRDARDVFASSLKRYGNDSKATLRAFMNAALTLEYLRELPTGSHVVWYHDLVSKPQDVLSGILDFVGLDPNLYDWRALEGGLVSNSSFSGIGPDDVLKNSGIVASVGKHKDLNRFHKAALNEILYDAIPESITRAPIYFRPLIYHLFLPAVLREAEALGYCMTGLRERMDRRN